MIDSPALRLIVTVLFSVAALYCLLRLLRRSSIPARGTYAAHFLMSLGMIAMAWPWGMGVAVWPQLLLFGAATVWFVVLAVSFGRSWAAGTHHELHGRLVYWYHAAMMGSMVWMLAAMDVVMQQAARAGRGHDHSSMAGMAMGSAGSPAVPIVVVAWCVGLFFCLATLGWLLSLVPERSDRSRGRPDPRLLGVEVGYEAAMAAGMAIMSFAFL